jgi:predicted ribosomally synthesized peptide with SipW-like signal peptide
MKKTLLGSAAAGALALTLIGGGTFAAWSDFSVQHETVGAGHLTLNVGSSYAVSSEALSLAPGINTYRAFYIASNDGDSIPNGNLSVKLTNLVDHENGCENNGEADAEDADRAAHAGADALDTDGDISDARCNVAGDAGELSQLASLQWRWTDPLPASTDCAAIPVLAANYPNAAPSGAISGLNGFTTPIETLAPGQGLCVVMSINTFDHPSRPYHLNAMQGDTLDFDVRFDLAQAL